MALEDVAKLIAPRNPDSALRFLRCFYGSKEGLTKEEIIRQTGMSPKMFEYFLTRMRRWRMIKGGRVKDQWRYFLTPEAFHARIDTLLVDAVHNLIK